MGRIASAVIVLAGSHLLAVGVLGCTFTDTARGQPMLWLALFGAFLMVAGFIAMLPGGWRDKRID